MKTSRISRKSLALARLHPFGESVPSKACDLARSCVGGLAARSVRTRGSGEERPDVGEDALEAFPVPAIGDAVRSGARSSEQVRGGVLERRALALQIGPGVVVNADGVHAGIPRGFPINDGDWGLF